MQDSTDYIDVAAEAADYAFRLRSASYGGQVGSIRERIVSGKIRNFTTAVATSVHNPRCAGHPD